MPKRRRKITKFMQNSLNCSKFAARLKHGMEVLTTKEAIVAYREHLHKEGRSLGLVPTMGALHNGHLELVRRACKENQEVLVSIFVNPTQFNDPEDLKKYPKSLARDVEKLEALSCSVQVFAPEVSEMYGATILSRKYDFRGMDTLMEGAHRPGHFDGVGTIVEALLQLTLPQRAYFGEKDYQQLVIIQDLVRQKEIPVEIKPCPIVREPNGLAMSSRNGLLTKSLRMKAGFIHDTLKEAKTLFGTKSASEVKDYVRQQFSEHPDFELEYIEIADADTLEPVVRKSEKTNYRIFVAAYLGGVRLIDNMALNKVILPHANRSSQIQDTPG